MQLDILEKSIVKTPPLKLPVLISSAFEAFLNSQFEVLPVISDGELKALYFKDAMPLIIGCNNGMACHDYLPGSVLRDIFYIDINSSERAIIEQFKKAMEHETSMAVLRGNVYTGMITLKSIVSFINDQKIKEAVTVNPLTKLPGNYSIKKEFEGLVSTSKPFCFCYADLNDFKAYNDKYGIAKGDEVIKFTAFLLSSSCENNFVGHIGGDDFVFYLPVDAAETVLNKIVAGFDIGIVDFYNESHRKQGFIMAADREGKIKTFPIMSISISAAIVDSPCTFECVSNLVAGLKEKVKKESKDKGGSKYAFDKRRIPTVR